jgi:hypothetical protein
MPDEGQKCAKTKQNIFVDVMKAALRSQIPLNVGLTPPPRFGKAYLFVIDVMNR